jgi:hypothetical protein
VSAQDDAPPKDNSAAVVFSALSIFTLFFANGAGPQ